MPKSVGWRGCGFHGGSSGRWSVAFAALAGGPLTRRPASGCVNVWDCNARAVRLPVPSGHDRVDGRAFVRATGKLWTATGRRDWAAYTRSTAAWGEVLAASKPWALNWMRVKA